LKLAEISVELIGHYGNDETVANAARVSFDKHASNYTAEQNNKLLHYLARNNHHSPFNHAFLSFRVKAPIFVNRQLVKHKFLPWNEVSRRYVDDEPEFYFRKFHGKAANVKQGCDETAVLKLPYYNYAKGIEDALSNYKDALELGAAPEDARMLLPLNMMSEFVWSGTLGAFLDMLVLRLDKHTQFDSRIVAKKISEKVEELFPISHSAYIKG
jgi:thymidylate synthase (FAD)